MSRIARKEALPLAEVFKEMIKGSHLAASHNTHRIFAAWNAASGAGQYTIRRFFRDGRLYITLSSSVVRTQLYMQRAFLLEKINSILAEDELFISDDPRYSDVKELILK